LYSPRGPEEQETGSWCFSSSLGFSIALSFLFLLPDFLLSADVTQTVFWFMFTLKTGPDLRAYFLERWVVHEIIAAGAEQKARPTFHVWQEVSELSK